MSRKHTRRRVVVPMPPRGLRPKLDAGQRLDLALVHNVNLDAIATGAAPSSMVWDYIGCVFTWWRVAQLLRMGEPELDQQLEVATRLVERYGRTGRVLFDGPDLQLARYGVVLMDELAHIVDRPTAVIAANWSEAEVNRMAAMVTFEQARMRVAAQVCA
jgi:hypothetical protein